MAFRKRTYARAFRRKTGSRKKSRFGARRRRSSGSKKVSFQNSVTGGVGSIRFKARRLTGRKWRSVLWRDTVASQHWRSSSAASSTLSTPADNTTSTLQTYPALGSSAGPFFQSGFGLTTQDPGVAVPSFKGDLVVRGGAITISVFNDSTLGPVAGRVWCVRCVKRPDFTQFNIVSGGVTTLSVDITQIPDFRADVGSVVLMRDFLLEALSVSRLEYRLPVWKLDQGEYLDASNPNFQYLWFVRINDFDPADVNTCRIVTGFNVSFSGDMIT